MQIECPSGRPDFAPEIAAEAVKIALDQMCRKAGMPNTFIWPAVIRVLHGESQNGTRRGAAMFEVLLRDDADKYVIAHEMVHVSHMESTQALYMPLAGECLAQAVERWLREHPSIWREADREADRERQARELKEVGG